MDLKILSLNIYSKRIKEIEIEKITSYLSGLSIINLEGFLDIEYPYNLNSFIVVMKNQNKYSVTVTEYKEED